MDKDQGKHLEGEGLLRGDNLPVVEDSPGEEEDSYLVDADNQKVHTVRNGYKERQGCCRQGIVDLHLDLVMHCQVGVDHSLKEVAHCQDHNHFVKREDRLHT